MSSKTFIRTISNCNCLPLTTRFFCFLLISSGTNYIVLLSLAKQLKEKIPLIPEGQNRALRSLNNNSKSRCPYCWPSVLKIFLMPGFTLTSWLRFQLVMLSDNSRMQFKTATGKIPTLFQSD